MKIIIMNDTDMSKFIGTKLTKLRNGLGFTQTQVSNFTGISQTYLGKIEAGTNLPSLSFLRTLLEFYEISFTRFFVDLE